MRCLFIYVDPFICFSNVLCLQSLTIRRLYIWMGKEFHLMLTDL